MLGKGLLFGFVLLFCYLLFASLLFCYLLFVKLVVILNFLVLLRVSFRVRRLFF